MSIGSGDREGIIIEITAWESPNCEEIWFSEETTETIKLKNKRGGSAEGEEVICAPKVMCEGAA